VRGLDLSDKIEAESASGTIRSTPLPELCKFASCIGERGIAGNSYSGWVREELSEEKNTDDRHQSVTNKVDGLLLTKLGARKWLILVN
jgi:hypothetical protein